MIRAITFIPASGGSEGLTYVERASRNRSLHVLLQDHSYHGTAAHPSSRRSFLRNAYREIVSRYVSFGRIEHPLPLARSLVSFLDGLSSRVDCRIDDFRGIGFYVLLQDGETFYLLTNREGRARLRTGAGFEAIGGRQIDGVLELPVETSSAQKELFSKDLRDFLALYKIDATAVDGATGAPGGALDLALGGSGEEMDTLIEALDQPGVVETGVPEKTILLNLISDKMMYLRFDGYVRMRELHALDTPRPVPKRRGMRMGRYVLPAAVLLLFVSLGTVWVNERLSRPQSIDETTARETPAPATDMAATEPQAVSETPGQKPIDEAATKRRIADQSRRHRCWPASGSYSGGGTAKCTSSTRKPGAFCGATTPPTGSGRRRS
jgi:hypothetical protein